MNPLSWPIEKAQKIIAIAAAVFFLVTSLTAFGLWQSTKGDLKRVTGERNVAQQELGACKVNRQTLTAGIEAQNAAIGQMQRDAEIARAEGDKRLQDALRTAQTFKARAERLSRAKPSSGDLCASARDLIAETLEAER